MNDFYEQQLKEAILSPKDRAHPRLKDADELFDYGIDYYA